MDDIFIINPNANILEMRDAVDDRLNKAQAVVDCLLAGNSGGDIELRDKIICKAIWAIKDYLSEIELLLRGLETAERAANVYN